MVRHVILWNLKDSYSDAEKKEIKSEIKTSIEGLAGKIPGLIDIKVYTEGLKTSNADLMLDSSFESEEALGVYANHPLHVEVANTKVRPFTAQRSCLDFEV